MLQKLCLMASHGFPPGLVLQQELAMGCQPLLPSPASKPEIITYRFPSFMLNPTEESSKSHKEWFNSNQIPNVNLSAQKPMLIDVQATYPSEVCYSFGIIEQSIGHDKMQFIMSESAETENYESQQPLTPLIYPNRKFYIPKPLLDIFQDSALSSKITVHPDGEVTFMGTGIEMKDLISFIAESCLSEHARKGAKQSMLVPHFSRLIISEVEANTHSSSLDIHSTVAVPLMSPEKVKIKPSQKRNKKAAKERDLYQKNYLHACESLLSLMVDKRKHRKTAILSLKKSGPELPELLTQFSAGIAGTGLAVLLSVICKLACGRVPFCASKLFNTGFGFGLVWLSWAVNKLRDTIIGISKNAGKLGLKDEEMIQMVDKSLREVYFRAAALLAVAVLRLA